MLDRQPAEAVAAGDGADVDLLAGTNTEEDNLYLAPFGNLSTSTAADVDATAARSHTRPAPLVEAYRRARPHASAGELRSAIMGDALFGAGTRRPVDAHVRRHLPLLVRVALERPRRRTRGLPRRRAFVSDVTGLLSLRGPGAILGPDEPPTDLAARMHAAWAPSAATHPRRAQGPARPGVGPAPSRPGTGTVIGATVVEQRAAFHTGRPVPHEVLIAPRRPTKNRWPERWSAR
ncbi:hypothetical protein ABT299_09840 [Spirillospora sp. NPDC000708]